MCFRPRLPLISSAASPLGPTTACLQPPCVVAYKHMRRRRLTCTGPNRHREWQAPLCAAICHLRQPTSDYPLRSDMQGKASSVVLPCSSQDLTSAAEPLAGPASSSGHGPVSIFCCCEHAPIPPPPQIASTPTSAQPCTPSQPSSPPLRCATPPATEHSRKSNEAQRRRS